MINLVREKALRLLREPVRASPTQIHNAIIDLRRNGLRGDENLLWQFLEHHDAMVVSATLYTLVEVHGEWEDLRCELETLAEGDPRDDMATPIQSTAIFLLSRLGTQDAAAMSKLIEIAEDEGMRDVPRATAWRCLAELFNVEWLPQYTEDMILCPESDECEEIRDSIRNAMRNQPE